LNRADTAQIYESHNLSLSLQPTMALNRGREDPSGKADRDQCGDMEIIRVCAAAYVQFAAKRCASAPVILVPSTMPITDTDILLDDGERYAYVRNESFREACEAVGVDKRAITEALIVYRREAILVGLAPLLCSVNYEGLLKPALIMYADDASRAAAINAPDVMDYVAGASDVATIDDEPDIMGAFIAAFIAANLRVHVDAVQTAFARGYSLQMLYDADPAEVLGLDGYWYRVVDADRKILTAPNTLIRLACLSSGYRRAIADALLPYSTRLTYDDDARIVSYVVRCRRTTHDVEEV
jgi:hypothetical protein